MAAEIVEIGSLPIQREKAALWRRLNDREPTRPLVFINGEPWPELEAVCPAELRHDPSRLERWSEIASEEAQKRAP